MKLTKLVLTAFFPSVASSAVITHNLNVEIIQVRDDAGQNATPLIGSDGGSYVYEAEVNEVWAQAGIQVSFTYSTWDNTEAQRLTFSERGSVFNNTFTSVSGDALPGIGVDTLQIFFVRDFDNTGYDGDPNSGWVGNPLPNPNFNARSTGVAELYISGTFISNGRVVMASEGFTGDSLSGVITHEIGHALGLRHVETVNAGAGAGTTQDPNFTVDPSDPNLMWGTGFGPSYNSSLNNDPELTVLQENFFLTQEQIDAAIFNGLDLDPDGNGVGVLQVIPEPTGMVLIVFGVVPLLLRRQR